MSRLARQQHDQIQAEILGVAALTGASVIGMKIDKPATSAAATSAAATTNTATGPGTVIAMIPKHLSQSRDVFLVRFDSGGDVEMMADEVQQFCVSRGARLQASVVSFADDVAEGDLLAIAPPDGDTAKFWLCWADAPLSRGATEARIPATWLERHENGLARHYVVGANDEWWSAPTE